MDKKGESENRMTNLLHMYCSNCFKTIALNSRLDDAILICPKCDRKIAKDAKELSVIWEITV